jgi:hypothetical protein
MRQTEAILVNTSSLGLGLGIDADDGDQKQYCCRIINHYKIYIVQPPDVYNIKLFSMYVMVRQTKPTQVELPSLVHKYQTCTDVLALANTTNSL